jgi:steroid delta-isomerase
VQPKPRVLRWVAAAGDRNLGAVGFGPVFVDEHVRRFNAAADSGVWTSFVDQFAADAVLEFVGPPVGPFNGRFAILDAYRQSPPDDKIELVGSAVTEADELVVPYKWVSTGATGTMRFTEREGQIAKLVVTFD